MSVLVVDVGNSAWKAGLFDDSKSVASEAQTGGVIGLPEPIATFVAESAEGLVEEIGELAPDRVLIGSVVRGASDELRSHQPPYWPSPEQLTYRDVPLALDVRYPDRTGIDRLAAAAAASRLRPDAVVCVVDLGTAATIDLVVNQTFLGGLILPGPATMFRSLSTAADALPDLKWNPASAALPADSVRDRVGRDTAAAMSLGVGELLDAMLSCVAPNVLRSTAAKFASKPAILMLTGGFSNRDVPELPFEVRVEPHLTLMGLAAMAGCSDR